MIHHKRKARKMIEDALVTELFEKLALVTALLKDRNQMNGCELATETSLAAVAAAEALLDKRRARATL